MAIEAYVPTGTGANLWAQIRDQVRTLVRDSDPMTGTSASHLMVAVTHFVAWAHDEDRSLDPEDLFVPEIVEEYVARECGHLAPPSRSTRRSALRLVGRRVTRRARWDSPAPVYPTSVPGAPYTADQCTWLVQCIDVQATPFRTRVLTTLIGLGLGAGLAPDEIAHVTARQIAEVSDRRFSVVLPSRIVPIRDRYALLITSLAKHLAADTPLIRDKPVPRIETLWSLLSQCEVPTPLRPLTVSRLRATWARDALCAPNPLPAVMHAYGRQTVQFIEPLLGSLTSPSVVSGDTTTLHEF